jgi:hypothetical protein
VYKLNDPTNEPITEDFDNEETNEIEEMKKLEDEYNELMEFWHFLKKGNLKSFSKKKRLELDERIDELEKILNV